MAETGNDRALQVAERQALPACHWIEALELPSSYYADKAESQCWWSSCPCYSAHDFGMPLHECSLEEQLHQGVTFSALHAACISHYTGSDILFVLESC